jgi:hypothetical protein
MIFARARGLTARAVVTALRQSDAKLRCAATSFQNLL